MNKLLTLLLFGGLSLMSINGYAQEMEYRFLVSWRAESYAPSDFSGKILPTVNSPISISFEIVKDGALVSLSNENVFWYVDDELVGRGRGLQTITFAADGQAGGFQDIRIQINDYKGQGKILMKRLSIPITRPEAVIENPFPNNVFSGSSVRLKGNPYFFNIKNPSELAFSWNVNGETPTGSDNPQFLDLNVPAGNSGASLNIGLSIQGIIDPPNNVYEIASRSITLNLK